MRPKLLLWIEGSFAPCSRSDFNGPYAGFHKKVNEAMATACVNFTDDYPKAVIQVSILIVLMLLPNHCGLVSSLTANETKTTWPFMDCLPPGLGQTWLMYATQLKVENININKQNGSLEHLWFIIQYWLLPTSYVDENTHLIQLKCHAFLFRSVF